MGGMGARAPAIDCGVMTGKTSELLVMTWLDRAMLAMLRSLVKRTTLLAPCLSSIAHATTLSSFVMYLARTRSV